MYSLQHIQQTTVKFSILFVISNDLWCLCLYGVYTDLYHQLISLIWYSVLKKFNHFKSISWPLFILLYSTHTGIQVTIYITTLKKNYVNICFYIKMHTVLFIKWKHVNSKITYKKFIYKISSKWLQWDKARTMFKLSTEKLKHNIN